MEDKKTEQKVLQELGNLVDAYEFILEEIKKLPSPGAGLNRNFSLERSLAENVTLTSRTGNLSISYVHSDGKRYNIEIEVRRN